MIATNIPSIVSILGIKLSACCFASFEDANAIFAFVSASFEDANALSAFVFASLACSWTDWIVSFAVFALA